MGEVLSKGGSARGQYTHVHLVQLGATGEAPVVMVRGTLAHVTGTVFWACCPTTEAGIHQQIARVTQHMRRTRLCHVGISHDPVSTPGRCQWAAKGLRWLAQYSVKFPLRSTVDASVIVTLRTRRSAEEILGWSRGLCCGCTFKRPGDDTRAYRD